MRWHNPYILLLLVLVPVFLFFLSFSKLQRRKRFQKFADLKLYDFFFQDFSSFKWSLKNFFYIISFFFLVISAARPQWDKEVQIVKKEGIDIVVCIDVSKSMDAVDIQPSRIERAKDQISLFIDQLKGDRIAIIAFAGESFVQCPLTDDYGAAKLFLNLLDTETVPSYGTNIGDALELALELFAEDEKHKVIIVASDGEDLEERSLETAEGIAKEGAIIYTLGIGSPEGSTIPITDDKGNVEYAKDDEGSIIFSKLDISTLTQIAKTGNGRFFPITPHQSEIFEIMQNINAIEKKKFDSKEFIRYKEQYRYFLILALVFFLIAIFMINSRKSNFKRVL
ncbi:VWA domain-containing protein [Candidatus Cloacimonadota bacterium]